MLGACGVTTGDEVASGGDSTTAPTDGEQTTTTASDGSGDTTETRPEDDSGPPPTDSAAPTATATCGTTDTTTGFEMGDEVMRDALIQGFVSIGLTDEQATCLADGYIELGLTDVNASPDVTQMMDLFTECGISLEDLGNIGADLGAGTT